MKRGRKRVKLSPNQLAMLVAEISEDKKATGIEVLDIRKVSPLADYFVILSGESSPQIKALASAIEERLSKKGLKPPRWEGKLESNWLILDLKTVVVHILGEAQRKRYDLEELWSKKAIIYHL